MLGLIRKFGFAAVVAGAIALMTLVVIGKSLLSAIEAPAGAPGGGQIKGPGGPGEPPEIVAVAVAPHAFSDAIQALGTAQARESIVITPKVADTIRRIRFDSGARVRAGSVLVEMSSVEQAADVAEARAADAVAQQDLARFQELFDRGFASQARLDAARATADAAHARLQAGGSRIADRTIVAPFSGVVGLRRASPGQFVRPGDQIATLDDLAEIKLDFDVPEAQLTRLARGVPIVAHTAAFAGRDFAGTISNVDSRVDPATRSVRVRAILPNADEALRPGMLMTVEIRSNPRQALAIPEIALLEEANSSSVFRVVDTAGGPTAQRAPVEVGLRGDGMAEVLSGLSAGDRVITEGVQAVRPGQAVRVAGEAAAQAQAGERSR